MSSVSAQGARFPRTQRLAHALEYQRVYHARLKKPAGPFMVFLAPQELPAHRLGLSVSRSVGNAVARNRTKRLVREAFRLDHRSYPTPGDGRYDIIVGARRPVEPTLEEVRRWLREGIAGAHREWGKRSPGAAP